ncbi:MAG: hypothetical protein K2K16_04395 [Ruminococcus sp.]|nr:hypothetical protein [Ruminococcus sp.]
MIFPESCGILRTYKGNGLYSKYFMRLFIGEDCVKFRNSDSSCVIAMTTGSHRLLRAVKSVRAHVRG